MRRLLILSLIIMALVLAACGGRSTPTPAPAPAQQPTNTPAAAQPTPTTAAAQPAQPSTRPAVSAPTVILPEVNPLQTMGDIIVAGSSTVYPLTERMAERFRDEGYGGNITIDSIGTGAGFERFCKAGETDISNASRPIRDSERENCRAIGREAVEFRVGTDALAVVVNPGNNWVGPEGLTLAELAKLFSSDVTTWNEVNPAWPNQPVKRFSPGTDSGTFDYFIEAVMDPAFPNGGEQALLSAANLQLSEDDNILVQGVAGDPYAIGYFGFAYFEENAGRLRDLAIEGVDPTADTVEGGRYPLARPLFIYSDAGVMAAKPQVADFINFYLTFVNDEVIDVGYFPASPAALGLAKANWLNATAK